MKKIFLLIITVAIATVSFAQNTFKAKVIDAESKEPLFAATVSIDTLHLGASTDTTGFAIINNIPNGKYQINISSIGNAEMKVYFSFPLANPNHVFEIELEPIAREMDEVVISTTRSSRTISDIPTRVEIISTFFTVQKFLGLNLQIIG